MSAILRVWFLDKLNNGLHYIVLMMHRRKRVMGLVQMNVLAGTYPNAQSRLCRRLILSSRAGIHVNCSRVTNTKRTPPPSLPLPTTLGIRKFPFFFFFSSSSPTSTIIQSKIMGSNGPNAPDGGGGGSGATIRIRKAEPADAEQIAALGTAVFTHSFKSSGCTDAQLQAYLDEAYTTEAILSTLTSSSYYTLVAVDSSTSSTTSTILGFALLNTASTEPVIEDGKYPQPVELQRLYVSLDAHGKGIGKGLMAEAERIAREDWGKATMWLGVWERNFVAQGLYAKLGFTRVGEHAFDVGGDLQTDWILVKAL